MSMGDGPGARPPALDLGWVPMDMGDRRLTNTAALVGEQPEHLAGGWSAQCAAAAIG